MKKNSSVLIAVIVVIIIVVGGFAIFHKKANAPTTSSTNASSSNNQSTAVNNAVLKTKSNSSVGQYLTDSSGNALYTYGGDSSGVSTVTGSLLASWPAYLDKGSTSGLPTNVGTIKRSDNGETQYTYKGLPLYTFVADGQGQASGNGVSNFQIAKP